MGGGAAVHIITLTIGGQAAVKITPIPGGQTALNETVSRGERVVAVAVDLV